MCQLLRRIPPPPAVVVESSMTTRRALEAATARSRACRATCASGRAVGLTWRTPSSFKMTTSPRAPTSSPSSTATAAPAPASSPVISSPPSSPATSPSRASTRTPRLSRRAWWRIRCRRLLPPPRVGVRGRRKRLDWRWRRRCRRRWRRRSWRWTGCSSSARAARACAMEPLRWWRSCARTACTWAGPVIRAASCAAEGASCA
mmetsp:Transcript_69333/g.184937  ORF Transcript_69333/g.184937 Transcript_69333/m.184937 type:complete len:203 (+) Transcript_69333:931-1539(+)